MDEIPVDVDNEINSRQESKESPLTGESGVSHNTIDEAPSVVEVALKEDLQDIKEEGEGEKGVGGEEDIQIVSEKNENEGKSEEQDDQHVLENPPSTEQPVESQSQEEHAQTTTEVPTDSQSDNHSVPSVTDPSKPTSSPQPDAESNTGNSTPALDGTGTPPTPRSTPGKPSVFKKASSIQKINLNKDFLKNLMPATSTSQSQSPTPRTLASEKQKAPSAISKALKPMVRNRLGNMGGPSMQRQGSGSSTPKSGRGSSPSLGRPGGTGNDVWGWRRQPPAQKEYSEEELQRQGVHLTARLTGTAGDDANKWADMDDDWSDEDVEEAKDAGDLLALDENHIEIEPIAPHLLESAALSRMPERQEETIIVSKNERFADVTYDRRDNRSPDDNIHGPRQIYNPKIGRFESVQPSAAPREQERQGRRNIEIMQRGGRRGSSAGRRRESLAKSDEVRQARVSYDDNKGYPTPSQRRTSFVERDTPSHHGPRRDSFISQSAISDADRSLSNASPSVEVPAPLDQMSPVDLIALQQKEMAESKKRALERRAKDEEERAAAAERARRKAAELAARFAPDSAAASDASKSSPGPSKASPAPATASPALSTASPQKASPLPPKASPFPVLAIPAHSETSAHADETYPKPRIARSDSETWTDKGEIIRKESPTRQESLPKRSAWGAIGPSQASASHQKHQQNGLFGNPNTLAVLNHTLGGDTGRRGSRSSPRTPRAPISSSNLPPPLQGWANFAGNAETRRLHDEEIQRERNLERERLEKERESNGPRTISLVDKWKRVEIKDPENMGDVAGRTVVSVLQSGYSEDTSRNLEVSAQKSRQEPSGSTSNLSNVLPSPSASPLADAKSPVVGPAGQGLGLQSPSQPGLGDKAPGSRDRSRFFPSPASTVVDMSPRVVHPIQPSADRSVFPPSLFSYDDLTKSPSTNPAISPLTGNTSTFPPNAQQGQQRHQYLSQYGQPTPGSPGQSLAPAPQIGGMAPRSAFSHTIPMSSPPLAPFRTKLPSVEDFDTVLARLRETMQTTSAPTQPTPTHDISSLTKDTVLEPQVQTRTDPEEPETVTIRVSGMSGLSSRPHLEISTRDVDEELNTNSVIKVSLPKPVFSISTRDPVVPIATTSRPIIKLPPEVGPILDTPDAKSRLIAIGNHFKPHPRDRLASKPPAVSSFRIQIPSITPVPVDSPPKTPKSLDITATPEALNLPAYSTEDDVFYPHREGYKYHGKPNKPFKHNSPRHPSHRKPPKNGRGTPEGSSSGQGSKVVARPSHSAEQK